VITRYLVSSDGHCLCDDRTEGTATFSKQDAEDIVKQCEMKGIKAQVIEIKIRKWLSTIWK
jgi:hypothetical protein